MLAISTPSDEGNMNFYTTMMESKDPNTGKLMFKVLKVGLACEACMKAGVASSCTHMYVCCVHLWCCLWYVFFSRLPVVLFVCRESFRPPWKSASKVSSALLFYTPSPLLTLTRSIFSFSSQFAMVKQIYSTQKGMFERESMGLNTEDADVVFPGRAVTDFMARRFPVHPETRVFLVAMDPSGGGDSSMSLLTVSVCVCVCPRLCDRVRHSPPHPAQTCMYQNRITVVAMDEAPIAGVQEMEVMLMRHVTALRAAYPTHFLVFALESNLGQEAAHAQAMLQRHRVARYLCIQEKNRIGVLTTAARKALYADNLRFYLEQGCIGLRETRVLTGAPAEGEAARVQQVLHEQLSNYRRVNVEAGPGKLPKRHFSGKIAGSRQDDLVLTLQL